LPTTTRQISLLSPSRHCSSNKGKTELKKNKIKKAISWLRVGSNAPCTVNTAVTWTVPAELAADMVYTPESVLRTFSITSDARPSSETCSWYRSPATSSTWPCEVSKYHETAGGGMQGVKWHVNSTVSPSLASMSDGGSSTCRDFYLTTTKYDQFCYQLTEKKNRNSYKNTTTHSMALNLELIGWVSQYRRKHSLPNLCFSLLAERRVSGPEWTLGKMCVTVWLYGQNFVRNTLWPRYLACWINMTLYRSSLKVKVTDQCWPTDWLGTAVPS